MKRLLVLSAWMAVGGGCGTEMEAPAAAIVPDIENPPTSQGLTAGIYTGVETCSSGFIGDEAAPLSTQEFSTITIDASGVPAGTVLGAASSVDLGVYTDNLVITRINLAPNGVQIFMDVTRTWFCENTCFFSLDGICDEVALCSLGTDCGDCGVFELTGISTETITQTIGGNLQVIFVFEAGNPLFSMAGDCFAVLSP